MGDYDPSDYTVDEVNEHLSTADADERERVLAAERDGKARKGILEAQEGTQDGPEDGDGTSLTTKGQTFAQAAEAATPDAVGYLGTSPEAERTGRRDKGLSQRNPAVMNQGGTVPDATPSVDDGAAIESLKDLDG